MDEDELPGYGIASLAGRFGPRVAKVVAAATIAHNVYRLTRNRLRIEKQRRQYLVSVEGGDDMYPEIHEWVLSNLEPVDRKALIARSFPMTGNARVLRSDDESGGRRVGLFYDGTREQRVDIGGFAVTVMVSREDSYENKKSSVKPEEKIIFTCDSLDARDAVLALLEELAATTTKREPKIWNSTTWGHWRVETARPRPLASVILKNRLQYELLADLKDFLAAEEQYLHWGQPWRRGYLFYGPPGTGKTSLAQALATDLGLDIYVIQLSTLDNDASLTDCLSTITLNSVLVLEDIDIMRSSRVRDDENKGVTMAGLLNALDGMTTPHGLITILTTNDREALDPALIRRGRVDREEFIDHVDWPQAQELCRWFADADLGPAPADYYRNIAPAAVIGIMRDAVRDGHDPVKDLQAFLTVQQ